MSPGRLLRRLLFIFWCISHERIILTSICSVRRNCVIACSASGFNRRLCIQQLSIITVLAGGGDARHFMRAATVVIVMIP